MGVRCGMWECGGVVCGSEEVWYVGVWRCGMWEWGGVVGSLRTDHFSN